MRSVPMEGPGGGWNVLIPETRRERMRGLRGRPPPRPRRAMLFLRCRSVHTLGMRSEVMVAFLDRELRVVAVRRSPPGRVLVPRPRARHVLECGCGSELRIGDRFRPARPAGR